MLELIYWTYKTKKVLKFARVKGQLKYKAGKLKFCLFNRFFFINQVTLESVLHALKDPNYQAGLLSLN